MLRESGGGGNSSCEFTSTPVATKILDTSKLPVRLPDLRVVPPCLFCRFIWRLPLKFGPTQSNPGSWRSSELCSI
eukprot:m.52196 g.52196  ORF g.52196 m.52196 type:complete len:75 (-) comp18252_c0_seq3:157-381(-)